MQTSICLRFVSTLPDRFANLPLTPHSHKQSSFSADAVFGRDGFLVGAETAYNVHDGKITRYAAAIGYSAPEYAITLHGLGNLNTFSASYYHRVSPDVEAGAKAVYDTKATAPGVAIEVGAKT